MVGDDFQYEFAASGKYFGTHHRHVAALLEHGRARDQRLALTRADELGRYRCKQRVMGHGADRCRKRQIEQQAALHVYDAVADVKTNRKP